MFPEGPTTLALMDWHERLAQRERATLRQTWLLLVGGSTMLILLPLVVCPALGALLAGTGESAVVLPARDMIGIGLLLSGVIWIVGGLTRRQDRAQVAQQLMDGAARGTHSPLAEVVMAIMLLGMIYSAWWWWTGAARLRVGWRLRHVDRMRAAQVLATIGARPLDHHPVSLLKMGERPESLRRVLGYLALHNWIDASPDGQAIWLVSPGSRAMRSRMHAAVDAAA